MNPRKGYQSILILANLSDDFELKDFKKFEKENLIILYLKRRERKGRCSRCGMLCDRIHSTDELKPRDLPAFGYMVRLVFDRFTVKCPRYQRAVVEDFWLIRNQKHKFTWRYECQLSRMTEEMPNISVARLEKLDDKTVFNIDVELLQLRQERQQLPANLGPHYSLDEVYYRFFPKGDPRKETSFVSNLVDLTHKKVIFNAPGRSQASATVCLMGLSPEQRATAQSFATDLHDPFHNAIRTLCPQAVVVLDRFHVMKLFNEALNEFRKSQLQITTDEDEKRLLRGSNKWILLSSPDNLNHKDRGLLDEIKALNERVVEALLIREHFVSVFDSLNVETAKARWALLSRLIEEADIKEFNKFFSQFKKWLPMLWDYFKHKTSSAVIEALNHKIKATKIAAYGYLNLRYFQLKILQRVGFLNSKYAPLPTRRPLCATP